MKTIWGTSKRITILISIVIMFSLIFVGLTSASSLGTVKQNDCITLYQSCPSCSYVNLTAIQYPNKTTILNDIGMTKSGTEYTSNFCNTSEIGEYFYTTIGDKNGVISTETISFSITPNGLLQSTSQGIGSAMFLILMVVLMFVFGFLGIKLLKNENLWVLGIFFLFLSSIFLIYNTWLGYEYHRLFTGLKDSAIPETIFYIFMTLIVLGLLVSLTLLFLNWKKVFKYIKKEIKRKESKDEDVEDWDFDKWGGTDYGK